MKEKSKPQTANPKPLLTPEDARKVLERDVANVVKKAAAGKTLTPKERALVESFAEQDRLAGTLALPGQPPPDFVQSYSELGKIFGLHRASFPRIRRQYPDAPKPEDNGRHSVQLWKQFLEGHPEIKCKSESSLTPDPSPQGEGDSKSGLELERLRQQVRDLKRDNDQKDGLLVWRSDVAQDVRSLGTQQLGLLRQKLENEYPAILEGLTPEQRAAIRKKGKELVDQIAEQTARLADRWKC